MIIAEPKKVKLELMDNEIRIIIEELERVPHDLFVCLGYNKLIKKLEGAVLDRGAN